MCVNFGDEILLRGEECKIRVNLNFSEKWQVTVVQAAELKFSRSRMTKWTSPLDPSYEI